MALFLQPSRLLVRNLQNLRCLTPKRNRVKEKWAATRPKYPPTRMALQHFDASYGPQLGQLWPSARIALLSEKKYGALLNSFAHEAGMEELQGQGCEDFIKADGLTPLERCPSDVSLKRDDSDVNFQTPLKTSPNIKCFVFPRANITRFKPARPDKSGLLTHYLMDAASVLPCLALDVQKGHTVLDLCAAPGGKTLALLQTQSIRFLCVNDSSVSRTSRLKKVLRNYVPKQYLSEEKLRITSFDGTMWGDVERDSFDRVLVDVPCTTDRHSLSEDDNNIFSKSRTGERRKLPQLQAELLLAGILAACPGGEIVYSTCTLSASQNMSVVQQAVYLAQENHNIKLQVVNLKPLTQMFQDTFSFAPDLQLGEMVVPHLTANFGPIYLCKLRKII